MTPTNKGKDLCKVELCPKISSAIETANEAAGERMAKYIVWHRPFTGIFLFLVLKFMVKVRRVVRVLRSVPSEIANPSAKVRDFSVHPAQSSTEWLKSNGPVYAFNPSSFQSASDFVQAN